MCCPGPGTFCASVFIVMLNIIFLFVGLAMTILGIMLVSGGDAIMPLVTNAIGGGSGSMGNATESAMAEQVKTVSQMLHVFESIAHALIVVGIFVVVLAVLGITGSFCWVKSLLRAYTVMMVMVFITHLVVFICLFTGVFGNNVRFAMHRAIREKYEGINSKESHTLVWNMIMVNYECCGLDNYTEFHNASKWQREVEVDDKNETMVTPVACCKMAGGAPIEANCTVEPSDWNNNWGTGCWRALHERVFSPHLPHVIGINVGLLVFEILSVALAIFLVMMRIKRDSEEEATHPDAVYRDTKAEDKVSIKTASTDVGK